MGVDWFMVIAGLLAGLALFLFGLEQISDALKKIAGDGMRRLLRKLTVNRVAGVFSGAVITGALQSSSVTTVLLVGFISAGLMSLEQAVPVILGADIGSTLTAQIIAFKVTRLGMVMLFLGFATKFASSNERVKDWGVLIMGLGLIFFGMEFMGNATYPLRKHAGFISLMASMDTPLLGILVGALFTAIVQSSAATAGIAILLASQMVVNAVTGEMQPLLGLNGAIAIVLGANIGTCATALLAAIGKPRPAVRAAVVHILFKIVGTIIWVSFIEQLGDIARWFSFSDGHASAARDVANAHTIFNVMNTLIFLPFTSAFVWVVMKLIPDKPAEAEERMKPHHIDDSLLKSPRLALDALRMELVHLGEETLWVVDGVIQVAAGGDETELRKVEQDDDVVDALHRACIAYARKIAAQDMNGKQSDILSQYLGIGSAFESISDIATTDLVGKGRSRLEHKVQMSTETEQKMVAYHARIIAALQQLIESMRNEDVAMAQQVQQLKAPLKAMQIELERHLEVRLLSDDPNRIHAYSLERDFVDSLNRIYYFSKRAAKLLTGLD